MPISKYRSIEELGPPPSSESPADNLRSAFELLELCYRLHPWPVHRGVRRYRSSAVTSGATRRVKVTPSDLDEFSRTFADLGDPEVVRRSWE